MQTPGLFGIKQSNRNFADPYYWGKNQFNSAFPVALACYMRSQDKGLIYVKYRDRQRTKISELGVGDVFGSSSGNEDLYFSFETRYDRFKELVHDDLPAIDLVVCQATPDKQIKQIGRAHV